MANGRNALLISSTKRRRSAVVRALGRAGFRVQTPDQIGNVGAPDLVVVLGSTLLLAEVKLMHAVAPHVPIFVAWVDRPEERFVTAAYAAGATSVVPAENVDAAWRNLYRVLSDFRSTHAVRVHGGTFLPSFHDHQTGRLEANRIGEATGLTLS